MITIVELDFKSGAERIVTPEDIRPSADGSLYWWIDLEPEDPAETRALLERLGVNASVIEGVIGPDVDGRYELFDDSLYFSVTEAGISDGRLKTGLADVVLCRHALVTVHRHPAEFVVQMRRTYREDFLRFAKSPGFLIYELADHLLDGYRKALRDFSRRVESVQMAMFGPVSDGIFREVAELTHDLLAFRAVVRSSRELFQQLAVRKSPFVRETTQPHLQIIADGLQRVSDDLLTERDTLTDTLNLYMGMVSHRTNRVVTRLTVVSLIFLPLGFLCGVYGTNFEMLPGTRGPYAFPVFVAIMILLTGGMVWQLRRMKWL